MSTVLVVDSDPKSRGALAALVRTLGHRVLEAEVGAAQRLLRQGEVEVLIANMRLRVDGDGDLLHLAAELAPQTRCILTAEQASADEYKAAISRGAVDVLSLPVDQEALGQSLSRALESSHSGGFHGSLHGLDLVDILQMLNRARRTVTVIVGGKAEIHLRDGEVVHAASPGFAGRPALREILMARGGSIDTVPAESGAPQTIDQRFDALLLDLMREIDEARAGRSPTPKEVAATSAEVDFAHLELDERTFGDDIDTDTPQPQVPERRTKKAETKTATAAAKTPLGKDSSGDLRGELLSTPVEATAAEQPRGRLGGPLFWGLSGGVAVLAGLVIVFLLTRGEASPTSTQLPASPQPGVTAVTKPLAPKRAGTTPSATDKAAADKVAARQVTDKVAAEAAAAKAAADKAAADKVAADKVAADKAAADKATDKVATDKAAADKAATDKATPDATPDKATARARAWKARQRARARRKALAAKKDAAAKAGKTPDKTPKKAPPTQPSGRRPAIGVLD